MKSKEAAVALGLVGLAGLMFVIIQRKMLDKVENTRRLDKVEKELDRLAALPTSWKEAEEWKKAEERHEARKRHEARERDKELAYPNSNL